MSHDFTRMNPDDLRDLVTTLSAMADAASALEYAIGTAPVIDLTGPLMIRCPLFPAQVDVAGPESFAPVAEAEAHHPDTQENIAEPEKPVEEVTTLPTPDAPKGPRALERASKNGEPWTDEEDEAILAAVASQPDASNNAVSKIIGPQLGRTPGAVAFRLKSSLSDRAEAARSGDEPIEWQPAPEPSPKPAPPVAPPENAPIWHREINKWLDLLGFPAPWSAGVDLDLVTGLARGSKLGAVALDLGIDAADCKARFGKLKLAATPDGGQFGVSEQTRLIEVLRARAASAVAAQ
ncbi:hypothetical protein [Oceaniglobus ichthyenteri]|uniref:hypothetical protein n=1 Tax=Oceaniglobus ichthyenteri TaxID=2136177 RepID=UPI000D39F04A|nr:hypothetical protein [Oceaniglobus ichthyenteri]